MRPKQRVLKAINLEEPDRVPVDLGSTNVTTMTRIPYEPLKKELGIDSPTKFMMKNFQIVKVDDDILDQLGVDTRGVHGFSSSDVIKERISDSEYINQFGVHYKQTSDKLYYDMVEFPLSDMSLEEYEDYVWPDPYDDRIIEGIEERARTLYEEGKYAIVGDVVESGIFEPSWYMRGFDKFLMDLVNNKEFIHRLLEDMIEFQLKRYEMFLDKVGEYLDIVFVGDDLAMTENTLMSPSTYREMVKPHQRKYFKAIKNMTDAKLMYHTDGNVIDFLDDLAEIGVDILNPIESVLDMEKLKREFGDKLCFWGGINNKEVLPEGESDEVKKDVKRKIDKLGPEGYVVSAAHNIQSDVPVENVLTMFKTAIDYG